MPVAVAEPGAVVARVPAAEQVPVVAESYLWRQGGALHLLARTAFIRQSSRLSGSNVGLLSGHERRELGASKHSVWGRGVFRGLRLERGANR